MRRERRMEWTRLVVMHGGWLVRSVVVVVDWLLVGRCWSWREREASLRPLPGRGREGTRRDQGSERSESELQCLSRSWLVVVHRETNTEHRTLTD